MEASDKRRTLKAYVCQLLEYPRWVIEREVDFSNCPHGAHYNEYLANCVNCRFARGCLWLNRHRTPNPDAAPLGELLEALGDAVEYLADTHREGEDDDADTRAWLRESRRFLRSQPAATTLQEDRAI